MYERLKKFLLLNTVFIVIILLISDLNTLSDVIFGDRPGAYIVTPIIEEGFRTISILFGHGLFYTVYLSVIEFIGYLTHCEELSVIYVVMRILAVGLHFSAYFIQRYFYNLATEIKRPKLILIGLAMAYMLHSIWNSWLALTIYNLLGG